MKRIILFCFVLILFVCGFSAETEKEIIKNINHSLEILMFASNAPNTSSNPCDYIRANQEAFDYIVSQGDTTLNYFLEEFKHGKESGLREFIMALACIQILGDKNPVKQWGNGREWYNLYIKSTNQTNRSG
ncbi:hypothetical protein [Ammoniphilus sp. 3BR4]|uniref:hypothetical protein n=1 Tax=Ammoniphilus sp. 3BR4 TaxID=3158265 RepID=UPI0034658392